MANGTKYFWLKLDKNFFKKPEIQILENMTGGKDFELFYLKLLCESTGHEGRLRLNETIPYNTTMLASVTNTPEVTVKEAIGHLTDLGLMTLLDDGTFFMNEVEKMVGSETDWAKKKRKQRLDAVEGDNVPKLSPKCPIEIEKEIEIDKEINNNKASAKQKPTRHKYGQWKHVLLSDEELNKLTDRLGTQRTNEMIERLDNYMESTGKRYKNFYQTILNWVKRDGEKRNQSNNQPKKGIVDELFEKEVLNEFTGNNGNAEVFENGLPEFD